MHFEFLVEDQSGKAALEHLVPKIIGTPHTFKIHCYKGIGHLPKDMGSHTGHPRHRILLQRLPGLLRGYGTTFAQYPPDFAAAVIVVCDLDDRNREIFHQELNAVLDVCHPAPIARFCLAIEEGEAWYLGDLGAVETAYPKARKEILNTYVNDSICGTWEKLADAIYPGGAKALRKQGWQAVGREKSNWATRISPHMDPNTNNSPSFVSFRNTLTQLAQDTR
ncbi:MAG: hypothetical protein HQL84_10090 [Magnetococcales bacterium]|nr:hypothetical protein [Magnetococcales bacterium]MBF0150381.1 hypothetical protein [Magnetococcales bacterium]MBF0631573.1 hypothetical protein [Magnetococcales bacterium]